MLPYVLGLAGSPRRHGNSETLLDVALASCQERGLATEKIVVSQLDIHPCRGCDYCAKHGRCVQTDEMEDLYHRLEFCDGLLVAAPIFFYGLPSQLKALIDRCQVFWSRKYKLKTPARPEESCPAMFLAVGATKGEKLFDGSQLTMKYFFEPLNLEYAGDLLLKGLDERGAVQKDAAVLNRASLLGQELADRIINHGAGK